MGSTHADLLYLGIWICLGIDHTFKVPTTIRSPSETSLKRFYGRKQKRLRITRAFKSLLQMIPRICFSEEWNICGRDKMTCETYEEVNYEETISNFSREENVLITIKGFQEFWRRKFTLQKLWLHSRVVQDSQKPHFQMNGLFHTGNILSINPLVASLNVSLLGKGLHLLKLDGTNKLPSKICVFPPKLSNPWKLGRLFSVDFLPQKQNPPSRIW